MKQSYKNMTEEQIINKEKANGKVYSYCYWFRYITLAGILISVRGYDFSEQLSRIIFFVLFIANEIVFAIYRKKCNDFISIFDNFCDPVKFISLLKTDFFIEKYTNKVNYICTLSVAFMEIGKYEEAYELLSYKLLDGFARSEEYGWVYYSHLAVTQLKLNKIEEFEKTLETLKQISESSYEKTKWEVDNVIVRIQIEKLIMEEKFSQADELFNNSDIQDDTMRRKVNNNYKQAQIARGLNDFEKTKTHLNFVIENGNKLYIVEKAKELLEKISGGENS